MRWQLLTSLSVLSLAAGFALAAPATTAPAPKPATPATPAAPVKTTPAATPAKTPPAASAPAVPSASAPATKSASSVSMEPGYQTNQPLPATDGSGGQTFELYIPRAEPKPGTRRPVLFVLGRSYSLNAKWINAQGLSGWAEETGAIVIGVNQLFVATPSATTVPAIGKALPTEESMDPYMALADSMPGVHPTVRIVVCDDPNLTGQLRVLAVAQRYPSKIGGFVMGPRLYEPYKESPVVRLGPGTGVAIMEVTWEAYAKKNPAKPYVIGTDDVYGNDRFEATIGEAFRNTHVPTCYVDTDDFVNMRPDRLRTALTWLVNEAWLTKTGTKKEELAAVKEDVKAQLKNASDESDVAVREAKLRDLLLLTGIAADDGKTYLPTWRQAALQAIDTRTEPLFKDIYMHKIADLPMMKGSPEAKMLGAKLAAFEADPKVKKEIEGEKKVRALAQKVGEIGIAAKTLDDAIQLQSDFIQVTVDYPDTLASREAKDWSDVLDRRIKNTQSKMPKPKGH